MADYSGTPLGKKLGLKAGQRVHLVAMPASVRETLAADLEGTTEVATLRGAFDFVHVFGTDGGAFAKAFPKLRDALTPAGMLWISWPKKASKVPTTLDEHVIREVALAGGLVDVKVCAVDDVWSGLKLVRRKSDR